MQNLFLKSSQQAIKYICDAKIRRTVKIIEGLGQFSGKLSVTRKTGWLPEIIVASRKKLGNSLCDNQPKAKIKASLSG